MLLTRCSQSLSTGQLDAAAAAITSLESRLETVKTLTDELHISDASTEEMGQDLQYITDTEMEISLAKLKLQNAVKDSPPAHAETTAPSPQPQRQFTLPKLTIPKFGGNVLEFSSFWDLFTASIDASLTLSPVQKFVYLKSLLYGEALKVIDGLPINNSTYSIAIKLLNERYGSTSRQRSVLITSLTEMTSPKPTHSSLRQFIDILEVKLRQLEDLDGLEGSDLLVPMIIAKLPPITRQQIARHTTDGKIDINLKDLRRYLALEAEVLHAGNDLTTTSPFPNQEEVSSSAAAFYTSTKPGQQPNPTRWRKLTCFYCAGDHSALKCQKVATYDARHAIIRKKDACFNCLGRHRVSQCTSRNRCRKCQKKHHSSLCRDESASDNPQGSEPPPKSSPPLTQQSGPQPATTPSLTSKPTPTSESPTMPPASTTNSASMTYVSSATTVLLKTAQAHVTSNANVSIQANILFDEGAQKSFVTQDVVKHLQLRPIRTETLTITTFAAKELSTSTFDVVRLFVTAINGDHLPIEALVVPQVTAPLKFNATRVQAMPHLAGLKLAHPQPATQPFHVHLLIGCDAYWTFIQDTVIRGGPNEPVAVQSKLGFLLSGPLTQVPSDREKAVMFVNTNPIEMFWDLETLGISEHEQGPTDWSTFKDKITYQDGKYEVQLPWKSNQQELPTNFGI